MSRPAPNLTDATPEESFLAAIANPWRRELVAWCATPRSKKEVFREFLCAGRKQRYVGLAGLVASGWLQELEGTGQVMAQGDGECYELNFAAPMTLSHLIGVTIGQNLQAYEDDVACDAAVAALRRYSCRRMVELLGRGPAGYHELLDFSGVPRADFLHSLTTLQNAYTVHRVEGHPYELTGAGFPALEGWLNRISVTSQVAA